jgi:hypothetical protein
MKKVFTYSPFIVVVSCKEATNKKIEHKVSKQETVLQNKYYKLLNLLGNRRYCDFDRTDFELSSMEKG